MVKRISIIIFLLIISCRENVPCNNINQKTILIQLQKELNFNEYLSCLNKMPSNKAFSMIIPGAIFMEVPFSEEFILFPNGKIVYYRPEENNEAEKIIFGRWKISSKVLSFNFNKKVSKIRASKFYSFTKAKFKINENNLLELNLRGKRNIDDFYILIGFNKGYQSHPKTINTVKKSSDFLRKYPKYIKQFLDNKSNLINK